MRRAAVIATLLALVGSARAEPERVLVELAVDGAPRGDRVILVGERGDAWLDADTLCSVRICPTAGFAVDADGTRYLRLASLGIRHQLDRDAGTLAISIDPATLAETTIELQRARPAGLEHLAATSLFVNYAVHGGVSADASTPASLTGFAETGLSVRGALAYSAVTVVDGRPVRGLTNVTHDRRDAMLTTVLGDDVVTGGPLGGGGVIGGLHLRRDFAVDPYFISQPTLTQTGIVTTPSTIEVYRDGQLVRREALPPGPFRVQDVVGSVGAESRVVVRDALGLAQQVMTSSYVAPQTALAAGLSQFSFSAGLVRRQLGTHSLDYGPPAALLVHRHGLTDRVTGSLSSEVSARVLRAGAGAVAAFGRVVVELEGAASASPDGTGSAASVVASVSTRRFDASALVRMASARFATLQLDPDADRAVRETGATLGWMPGRWITLSVQGGHAAMRDTAARSHVGASAGVDVGRGWRAQLSTVASASGDERRVEAMATLGWTFGARTMGSATTGVAGTRATAAASLSRALSQADGIGYQAQARTGAGTSALARVDAQARFGRASASAQWAGERGSANVELAGGLVAIGGRVKATRPVQGGFALVRAPGAANVRGYLDNRLVGRTDARGDLVVPDLQPFYGNRLRVDVGDLPMRLAIDAPERVVAPPRRGGIVVQMTREPLPLVRGSLAIVDGAHAIDASFGDLVVAGRPAAPIGHGGLFEIESLARGTHRATAVVEGRRCTFVIDTRATSADTIELGTVRCALAARITEAP